MIHKIILKKHKHSFSKTSNLRKLYIITDKSCPKQNSLKELIIPVVCQKQRRLMILTDRHDIRTLQLLWI